MKPLESIRVTMRALTQLLPGDKSTWQVFETPTGTYITTRVAHRPGYAKYSVYVKWDDPYLLRWKLVFHGPRSQYWARLHQKVRRVAMENEVRTVVDMLFNRSSQ